MMQKGLPTFIQNEVVKALLLVSNIEIMKIRQNALRVATTILGEERLKEYLLVAVALRKSVIFCLKTDFYVSEKVI